MNPDDHRLAEAIGAVMQQSDHASRRAGIEVVDVGPGTATTQMVVREDMINTHEVCHGGYVFLLADTAFAYACNSRNISNVAAGCHIEFLRTAHLDDELTARARERHFGRRGGLYDIEVLNQSNEVVAVVRGRSAALNKTVLEGYENHE